MHPMLISPSISAHGELAVLNQGEKNCKISNFLAVAPVLSVTNYYCANAHQSMQSSRELFIKLLSPPDPLLISHMYPIFLIA